MYKNKIDTNHLALLVKIIEKYNNLNKKEINSFIFGNTNLTKLNNYTLHFNIDKNSEDSLITIKIAHVENCKIYYTVVENSITVQNLTKINLTLKNNRQLISAIILTILIRFFKYNIDKPIYYSIERNETAIGVTVLTKLLLMLKLYKNQIMQTYEKFKK